MDSDPLGDTVRDGLFLAASRTYAEQYIEPFVRAYYGYQRGGGDQDALDASGRRYEIKACKVMHSSTNRRGTRSLLERVRFELDNTMINRAVPFGEAFTASYDANVQNVKRDHFDELIYVLMFEDCLKIFRLASSDIAKGKVPNWSDKHGRYDALGKSGQFNIKKGSIQWHLDNTLDATLSYDEVAVILSNLSEGDE